MNKIDVDYASLRSVLDGAYEQATIGKGKERHVQQDSEKFEDQPICEMGRRLGGPYGPCYQATKKIYEAIHLPPERAIPELYGAINYLAAAVILIRESEKTVGSLINTVV